jgi:hypothetical protein
VAVKHSMVETEGELGSFVPWHLMVANFLLQDNRSHGLHVEVI